MNKKTKSILWVIIGVIIILFLFTNIGKKEAGAITREFSLPSLSTGEQNTVQSGQSFTVKYTQTGTSSPYFFTIKDSLTGSCNFVGTGDSKSLSTFIISPYIETEPVTIETVSTGICTIEGFYILDDGAEQPFPSQTIAICNPVNGGWSSWGAWSDPVHECGTRERICNNPLPSCGGEDCSGSDTETKECFCPIVGDTYPECDGIIVLRELTALAARWVNKGGPDTQLRTDLLIAAQNWISHGGPI